MFPDGMTEEQAAECFEGRVQWLDVYSQGAPSEISLWGNEIGNRLKPEAIEKYGLLFLPAAGLIDSSHPKGGYKGWLHHTESSFGAHYLAYNWFDATNHAGCYHMAATKGNQTSTHFNYNGAGLFSNCSLSNDNYFASIRLAVENPR